MGVEQAVTFGPGGLPPWDAVAALLGGEVSRISSDELDRLAALIASEKNEGSL